MRRLTRLLLVFSLGLAAGLSDGSTASARCAVVTLAQEVERSPFVVEAVLESAGDTARFRTVTVWKGGTAAPVSFSLEAQRGRGRWEWADSANEGQQYVLFLAHHDGRFFVARCGQSGDATDTRRSELRAQGLTPSPR